MTLQVRNGLNVLLLLKTRKVLFDQTTKTYDSIYFNNFIFHALKHNILKRVINNNISGSSWYFKRFVYLAVKILDGEVEISVNRWLSLLILRLKSKK